MKKYSKLISLRNALALLITGMAMGAISCTSNFDDINKDKDKVLSDDLNKDNMWAAYIQSMQLSVFAEDDNAYQRMDDLAGNTYSGYSGQSADYGGRNPTNYFFAATIPWNDVGFQVAYGTSQKPKYPIPGIMNSWNIMRQKVDSSSVVFAIGEVVKVTGMHRITDMYGPMPYTKYGNSLYTEYDSQETVYKSFFKELDHAIQIMTNYYNANPSAKPIAEFDMIFGSDMQKWIRYANSLKLRLAMRIKYVEPALAKRYAEEAVSHPLGVIIDNGGTAAIKNNSIYPFTNPIEMIWNGYANMRMGASMESYLKGYNDPRIETYFTRAIVDNQYHGVRAGIASNGSRYIPCSTPNIGTRDALYWLHAAEVYFLRAEGAIEGWDMGGTAADLYNQGIQTSMDMNELSGKADAYINDNTSKPARFNDYYSSSYSINAMTDITIKWNESDAKEKKLERIITQKWLAMYPNGQEAWSEFRRTGYPKLFPVVQNNSNGKVDTNKQIRRIPLPFEEYTNNKDIVNRAVTNFLNGDDSPGQNLWWDAKP